MALPQRRTPSRTPHVLWILGWALALSLIAAADAAAATLRYLPDAPFNTGASTGNQYGDNLTNFDQQVICMSMNVGTIRFDYNTYGGTPTGGAGFTGGGALSGGFFLNPGFVVEPGDTLSWVQTVTATISGNNVWNAPNGTEFPDTANKNDPAYPFQSVAQPRANVPQPTVGFQDFPNRFPSDGAQSWLAELGLVCLDSTEHTAEVIDTFLWGFGVTAANPGTIANITPNPPSLWGPPTQSYLDTLNNSFNGQNGSTMWTFTADPNDCCISAIPEPSSLVLGGTALLVGLCVARLRSRPGRKLAA